MGAHIFSIGAALLQIWQIKPGLLSQLIFLKKSSLNFILEIAIVDLSVFLLVRIVIEAENKSRCLIVNGKK